MKKICDFILKAAVYIYLAYLAGMFAGMEVAGIGAELRLR
jgi:hypothetical protein